VSCGPSGRTRIEDHFDVLGRSVSIDAAGVRVLEAGREKLVLSRPHLMFSVTNAIELAGPQGRSIEIMREFLDQVGPHWFPVELDAKLVVDREINRIHSPEACLSTRFAKDFFNFVTRPSVYAPGSGEIVLCDANIFNLGAIFDWMQPQRDSLTQGKQELDTALTNKITGYRAEFEEDPGWLDENFPALTSFNPAMPALFTYANIVRGLVQDAKAFRLKKAMASISVTRSSALPSRGLPRWTSSGSGALTRCRSRTT
jgi:hypothetical protein